MNWKSTPTLTRGRTYPTARRARARRLLVGDGRGHAGRPEDVPPQVVRPPEPARLLDDPSQQDHGRGRPAAPRSRRRGSRTPSLRREPFGRRRDRRRASSSQAEPSRVTDARRTRCEPARRERRPRRRAPRDVAADGRVEVEPAALVEAVCRRHRHQRRKAGDPEERPRPVRPPLCAIRLPVPACEQHAAAPRDEDRPGELTLPLHRQHVPVYGDGRRWSCPPARCGVGSLCGRDREHNRSRNHAGRCRHRGTRGATLRRVMSRALERLRRELEHDAFSDCA